MNNLPRPAPPDKLHKFIIGVGLLIAMGAAALGGRSARGLARDRLGGAIADAGDG